MPVSEPSFHVPVLTVIVRFYYGTDEALLHLRFHIVVYFPGFLGRQVDLEAQSECQLIVCGGIAETYCEVVFQQSFQADIRRDEISDTRTEADTQTVGAHIVRAIYLG